MKRLGLPFGGPALPLPAACDVAIVGGGIMGLAIAYHLAKTSRLRIVVIERDYLVSGASGRNGGGVRMQWGDEGNVELMMESIGLYRHLAQELGINVWFRQGGYLFIARSDANAKRLERNVELHRHVGAPTRLLTASEALDIVPQLDVRDVKLASFNPDDGVVFPWPLVWGHAAKASELGVAIRTHTSVLGIDPNGSDYVLRLSTGERVTATRIVNATGAWANELNRGLGIVLPNHPHRHEILSTEPLKPFLQPLVVDLETGLYFSQSTRGEIVTGISMPAHESSPTEALAMSSSLAFLGHLARSLIRTLPLAHSLRVLRQWSGPYDVSPDGDAIVGASPGHPNIVQVCGFTGHGLMMAPAVARMLARWLAQGDGHPMLQRWDPLRFASGKVARREDMIIG